MGTGRLVGRTGQGSTDAAARIDGGLVAALAVAGAAQAEITGGVVRLGVLNDQSSQYADFQGPGSVLAARMAVEDFGGKAGGAPVEVVFADHQNKADTGAGIARAWMDRDGVDVILDVPNSSVTLAVTELVREKNKVLIAHGGASSDLTGPRCTPNFVHWVLDTWAQANGVARSVTAAGGKTWFMLTSDYAFGHDLEAKMTAAVKESGGTVVGSVRHPFNNQDFAAFLLQAQGSKAQVLGLANAGGDTTNSVKQAVEFGLPKSGMKLAAPVFLTNNVHAVGLEVSQGIQTTNPWYWDMNEPSRAFAQRFAARHEKKAYPNEYHAGVYAAVLHYLKAVDALKSDDDGRAVVEKMKALADRRPPVRQGQHPRRRPQDPPDVSLGGQEPGGVEGRLGLLQAGAHDTRRPGVPAARRGRLPAGQVIRRRLRESATARRCARC